MTEGAGDPEISRMPWLEQVIQGIKYTQARGKKKGKARLPISVDILHKLSMAKERHPRCSDALGSSLLRFFRLLPVGGDHGANGIRL